MKEWIYNFVVNSRAITRYFQNTKIRSPFSQEAAQAYLAGILDGEGSVSTRQPGAFAKITNTDRSILRACVAALEQLGIAWTIVPKKKIKPHYKQCFNLCICRHADLVKLSVVPLQHNKKLRALKGIAARVMPIPKQTAENCKRAQSMRKQGFLWREIASNLGVSYQTARRLVLANKVD